MRRAAVMSLLLVVFGVANAKAETRTLNFKDFDQVAIGSGMHLSIIQGEIYRVQVTGEAKDLDRLNVQQTGKHLDFSVNSNWTWWFNNIGRIQVDITLPSLQGLDLSGGSQGTLNMQIGSRTFGAGLSGGSSLNGQLRCGDIDLNLSGGSRVGLSGTGDHLNVKGSGGSQYQLKDFSGKNLRAHLSGGSQATVALNGELTANLSGGSLITYYGNAALGSISTSGGSKVRKGL